MTTVIKSNISYIKLGDLRLEPDYSGALYAPDFETLIVADLHFEKASALYEKTGSAYPPFDTRDTLLRLGDAIDRQQPKRIIFLGDTWHDEFGFARMQNTDHQLIRTIRTRAETVFISGNHDTSASGSGGPKMVQEIKLGDVVLSHEPFEDANRYQICGHLHPVAKLMQKGRTIRRRCFFVSDKQCILPAMGALSGGLNCCDPVFDRFMSYENRRVILLGRNRLFHLGMKTLLPDRS